MLPLIHNDSKLDTSITGTIFINFNQYFQSYLSDIDNKFCIEVILYCVSNMHYADYDMIEYIFKYENRGILYYDLLERDGLEDLSSIYVCVSDNLQSIDDYDFEVSSWYNTVAFINLIQYRNRYE